MKTGRKPNVARNARILKLRGKMSYSLIAEAIGVLIGTVSGVCFRDDYPLLIRRRKTGTHSKIGTGHHGTGIYARKVRKPGPKPATRPAP